MVLKPAARPDRGPTWVRDKEGTVRREIAGIEDEVMAATDYEIVPSALVIDEQEFQSLLARERRLARDIVRDGIRVLD